MKNEINGKSYKRAYRRHCFDKKFKQRAKKRETWFRLDCENRDEFDRSTYQSWAKIWKDLKEGKYGHYLRTTGQPCSCEMCRYPYYKREEKSKVLKRIWKDIQDEAEDSTLGC